MRRLLPFCLLIVSTAAFADGPQQAFRFAPEPLARCREFMLLETSFYQTPFAGHLTHENENSADFYFSWEAGAMANTSAREAWGATLYFGNDLASVRVGVLPRYRRWLGYRMAADISVGPFLIDTDVNAPDHFPGVMTRGALHLADLIAFSTQLDMVRRGAVWEGRAMIGFSVGSYSAIPMYFINMGLAVTESEGRFQPEHIDGGERHLASP